MSRISTIASTLAPPSTSAKALAAIAAVCALCGLVALPTSHAAKPIAYVACNPDGGSAVLRQHPLHCTILPPSAAFAEGVNLKSLNWKHWGTERATLKGIEVGFHLPPENIKVHGSAYRLRPSPCGGQMVYTRVKVTSRFGTTVARPKACE
jgi:hypothetical protein